MRAYLELARDVLAHGEDRDGDVTSFAHRVDFALAGGVPLAHCLSLQHVFHELRWMLVGETSELWLRQRGVLTRTPASLASPTYGRRPHDLGPVEGRQLRNWGSAENEGGLDQLAALVAGLRDDPSGSHVVTVWNPSDHPYVYEPPDMVSWQVFCHRDRGLSARFNFRVTDLVHSAPRHLAMASLLVHLLAVAVDREPRRAVVNFGEVRVTAADRAVLADQIAHCEDDWVQLEIEPHWRGRVLDVLTELQWTDIVCAESEAIKAVAG